MVNRHHGSSRRIHVLRLQLINIKSLIGVLNLVNLNKQSKLLTNLLIVF